MKELLLELFSMVLEAPKVQTPKSSGQTSDSVSPEDQQVGTALPTRGGRWRAKQVGTNKILYWGDQEIAVAWAKGQRSDDGGEKDDAKIGGMGKEDPQLTAKKQQISKDLQGQFGKPPKTPRVKRAKIESVPATRDGVITSLGKTPLDVKGLMDAIEGKESETVGEKGAGTTASTAGEAATTLALEKLRALRANNSNATTTEFLKENMPQVVKLLSELRGVKGSALSEDWAEAARKQVMAMFTTIEEKYKVKISEIAWDNASGRNKLKLGPKPKSDRSDLYVKGSDGKIIGISLKKDGNIFLANQGLIKVLESIAVNAPDEETRKKITRLGEIHRETFEGEIAQLQIRSAEKRDKLIPTLKKLKRDDINDVDSPNYDDFFKPNGSLTDEAIQVLTSGGFGAGSTKQGNPNPYSNLELKLFTKVMGTISDSDSEIKKSLDAIRGSDREVTQTLLEMIQTDNDVNKTMTNYLIDSLDLAQLVTPNRPFGADYPVDKFFIAYGEANLQENGEEFPMSVTRDTILSTLGLPSNISDEELQVAVKDRFVVDAEDDAKKGFLRLRIKNENPPPSYFYPSIATLSVRARGLGTAPTMELAQHSGWTFTLLNKTANTEEWPPHHRYAQAKDSVAFLMRQIKNPVLTDEQRTEIEKDIEFYKQQMRG